MPVYGGTSGQGLSRGGGGGYIYIYIPTSLILKYVIKVNDVSSCGPTSKHTNSLLNLGRWGGGGGGGGGHRCGEGYL